jgi:hypothetical protein
MNEPLLFHSIMQAPDKIYSFYMVDISSEINGKLCSICIDSLDAGPKTSISVFFKEFLHYFLCVKYMLASNIVIFHMSPLIAFVTFKFKIMKLSLRLVQGVKKKCRLSLLTNSALVYESQCGGMGGGGCGVSANEYSCAHGAQINFGDLPPYLTYGLV